MVVVVLEEGKKIKKRIGVHAFSAVLQLHGRRFKGASVFCLAVVK